jgi:hypothetical protein
MTTMAAVSTITKVVAIGTDPAADSPLKPEIP